MVWNQSFAKARDFIDAITQALVERDHSCIADAHLHADLGAAPLFQCLLAPMHERARMTFALMRGRDSQIVDPAAMAFKAEHGAGNEFICLHADDEHLWLHSELAGNVFVRIVPWAGELASLPERDDVEFV